MSEGPRSEMGCSDVDAQSTPVVSGGQDLTAMKQLTKSLEKALDDLKARIERLQKSTPDATE